MRLMILLALTGITSLCFAESMTQTDWSGGPGESTPVNQWQSMYRASSGMDIDTPGEIGLGISFTSFESNVIGEDYGSLGDPALADFDGDGDLDVICDDFDVWEFSLFENLDGAGGQWQKHVIFDLPWPPTRCSMPIDLDQDGDIDLLTACGHFFTYWENTDGSGLNWDEHTLEDEHEAFDIICFDIDLDGDNDVIGCCNLSNLVLSWENLDGAGHEWIQRTIADQYSYPSDLSEWDYDGDSDMDFFCNWKYSNEICLYENAGEHMWIQHMVISGLEYNKVIPVADFDNDSDVDIAVFFLDNQGIYENIDGSCSEWEFHPLPPIGQYHTISYDTYTADLDLDGDMDIFGTLGMYAGTPVNRGFFIFENTGGSCDHWVFHMFVEENEDFVSFCTSGDINGDGLLDFPARDLGENDLVWFDVIGPADTGWVESSILEVTDTDWGSIDWTVDLPSGTDIFFQVRSSDDWENMDKWSIPIEEPGSLEDLLEDGDPYVQYLATITREESSQQPRLNDVTLSWLLGLEGSGAEDSDFFIPNPSRGSVTARVNIAHPSNAVLRVFDISGRLVVERYEEEMQEGYSQVYLGDMPPGMYFCRMITDDEDMTASFVVLR